jgi:hypothetical protein
MRLLVVALLAVAVGACGSAATPRPAPSATPSPTPTPTRAAKPRPVRDVPRSHCPAGVAGCRAVRGTAVYVEHVDPDGDGDLHVVVAAGSISLPGVTSIDVAVGLRPKRDPGVGDRVSAAGTLETGSYGQTQIHALELHVRR